MSIIICPNCKSALLRIDRTYRCDHGHSFDISKEGYINLLLPNQKKKQNPGDSKAMMAARDLFLSAGHYDFLIDHIDNTIADLKLNTDRADPYHLLDIGCGTVYYTRSILESDNIIKTGLDISKHGVAKAAKKDRKTTYFVGSAINLPIADHSTDIIINIFSPVDLNEIKRVLKAKGLFIKVIPHGNHMKEVADLVYDEFTPHTSAIENELNQENSFSIMDSQEVKKTLPLVDPDIQNLISMTPYFYKFKQEDLDQLKDLTVSISFKVIIARSL